MRTFTIIVEITGENIDDVLCGAFEGGSNYWIQSVEIIKPGSDPNKIWCSDQISRGGELKIVEDEDGTAHTLTLDKMLKGIALNGDLDFDQMDAGDYDNILQYALFGKLIYG